jgi:hypothetical protein
MISVMILTINTEYVPEKQYPADICNGITVSVFCKVEREFLNNINIKLIRKMQPPPTVIIILPS